MGLDVGCGEGEAGGAAVDDAPDGEAVGFAIAGGGVSDESRQSLGRGVTNVVTLNSVPKVDIFPVLLLGLVLDTQLQLQALSTVAGGSSVGVD